VSLAYDLPLESNWIDSFTIEGRALSPSEDTPSARLRPVSPGYLSSLGVPLRAGREFTDRDQPGRPGAVIINEALARRYFPNEEPLGKRILARTPSAVWGEEVPRSQP
jgi:putative ABC transport system permease protein